MLFTKQVRVFYWNFKFRMNILFFLFIFLLKSPIFISAQSLPSADSAVRSADYFAKMPRVSVPDLPFLFLNQREIEAARALSEKEEWAKKVKENYIRIAETWVSRDYDFIIKIIPAKGSLYINAFGMDLDPVQQKKLKWRGWEDPLHVIAEDGTIYPNTTHKDDGSGWIVPETKRKFYFMALANGRILKQLETIELPALVNAYLLTGRETYAERALWILDAIATIYPRANEGPIDYPDLAPGKADGGRLDRPYYQAARAMMNYAFFYEMLVNSIHARQASRSNNGMTQIKNIELNLLMNGADYCRRMAKVGKGASYELNNGNIDYNRAPLIVGAMLGITEWVDRAIKGPLGFRYAFSNTIDMNGRYFETSALYAHHTRELLLGTAHFLKRMKLPAYPNGYNAYDDLKFAKFALDFYTGIEVAGRVPHFGDSEPDNKITDGKNIFDKGTLLAAKEFYTNSEKIKVREAALETGAQMLANTPADFKYDESDLFNMYKWEDFVKQARLVKHLPTLDRSTLFFDYGTMIFRSGKMEKERAALIRFGPTLNHGHADELGLNFYARGREFSFDPGYYNAHMRFGFTIPTVAHNVLVVNRTNQLRRPSPGGDLQTWTDGEVLRSAAVNDPKAYSSLGLTEYKRRVALIDLSPDDSYIIDNFWALGGQEYDYSLHGISEGKLQVLSTSTTVLKEKRSGSILSQKIDYSAELDPNGRVASFPDAPYYFAPPGAGFGFLSNPSFYSLNGPARLQWSATDSTNHQMYVWHFAPPSSELITAHSPKPKNPPMDLTYALSHVKVPASEPVHFTSVILQTAGENKLSEVHQLLPKNGSQSVFALHLVTAATISSVTREHFYMAANKITANVNFDKGISFAGEEGFLGLDAFGKVISASLTGSGHIIKDDFKFTVTPLFTKPMKVLQIENQPLRLLVDASYKQTKHLENSIIRLNKSGLARPFVLRVNKSEAAGKNSWLTIDAFGNTQAIGRVQSYDPTTHSIITDAPFPHLRPYTYTYSEKTGYGTHEENIDYSSNEGYNGFWLVGNQKTQERAVIKNIVNKNTQIILDENIKGYFKAGDQFEIQLLAPGDQLEVPVWSQARRDKKGNWQIKGTAVVTITK